MGRLPEASRLELSMTLMCLTHLPRFLRVTLLCGHEYQKTLKRSSGRESPDNQRTAYSNQSPPHAELGTTGLDLIGHCTPNSSLYFYT